MPPRMQIQGGWRARAVRIQLRGCLIKKEEDLVKVEEYPRGMPTCKREKYLGLGLE